MSSEVAAVEKVLQVYFDGLYEGDTKKLGEAFHPASHLYAAGGDGKASDWPRGGSAGGGAARAVDRLPSAPGLGVGPEVG